MCVKKKKKKKAQSQAQSQSQSMLTSACVTQFAPSPVAMFGAYDRKATELDAMFPTAPQYNGVYGAGMDSTEYADPFAVTGMTNANITQFAPSPVAMFPTTACYGPERNNWWDPFSEASTPDYLTGHASTPDYQACPASEGLKLRPGGPYDPLGLAENPDPHRVEGQGDQERPLGHYQYVGPAGSWAASTAHAPGANDLSLALMGQVTPSPVAMFAACGHNAAEFSAWYGSDCSEWLDPERSTSVYLTGAYPGDCRWGTADLGADQITLEQYREAELIHARWALLDIMDCLAPEILANLTGSQLSGPAWFQLSGPAWFQTGVEIFQEGSSNPSLIHDTPIFAVLTCQVLLQGAADAYRANQAGRASKDPGLLPGSTFNPLGLADDLDSLAEFKEVQKRRLAMFSMLGFSVQAIVTSEGPVGNWATHVADAFRSYSLSLALMDQVAPSSEAMLAACDRVSDNLTAWYRSERNEWLSPPPDTSAPYYLTGEFPGNPSCLAAMASVQQTQGPFHMPPDHAPVPVPSVGVFQCAAGHGLAPLLGAAGTSLASWHCTGELSPPPLPWGHVRWATSGTLPWGRTCCPWPKYGHCGSLVQSSAQHATGPFPGWESWRGPWGP